MMRGRGRGRGGAPYAFALRPSAKKKRRLGRDSQTALRKKTFRYLNSLARAFFKPQTATKIGYHKMPEKSMPKTLSRSQIIELTEKTKKSIEDKHKPPETPEPEETPEASEATHRRAEKDRDGTTVTFSTEAVVECLRRGCQGDSDLFVELHRDTFCYDPKTGRWNCFIGHTWKEDERGQAFKAIDGVVDAYTAEAVRQAVLEVQHKKNKQDELSKKAGAFRDSLLERVAKLRGKTRRNDVLYFSRSGAGTLVIHGDEWDSSPLLMGCKNGIVDLSTGNLRDGAPSDYIKTSSPVEYTGTDTSCPLWEKTLSEVFNGNDEIISFLQRFFGYAITGKANIHKFPVFYGTGRNGKTLVIETISNILGKLAHKASAETLMESGKGRVSGQADADTYALRGKRLVFASETKAGGKLNASRIKELSGGDTLNARAPYAVYPVEFTPSHSIALITNHKPTADASDFALWERILLIPFEIAFVDREPTAKNERRADPTLFEKLKAEYPGILGWMVRGCLAFQEKGLEPPDCITAATRDYRNENDILASFIDEQCSLDVDFETTAKDLYAAYKEWAETNGYRPLNVTNFGKKLKDKFDSYKSRKGIMYIGICVNGCE